MTAPTQTPTGFRQLALVQVSDRAYRLKALADLEIKGHAVKRGSISGSIHLSDSDRLAKEQLVSLTELTTLIYRTPFWLDENSSLRGGFQLPYGSYFTNSQVVVEPTNHFAQVLITNSELTDSNITIADDNFGLSYGNAIQLTVTKSTLENADIRIFPDGRTPQKRAIIIKNSSVKMSAIYQSQADLQVINSQLEGCYVYQRALIVDSVVTTKEYAFYDENALNAVNLTVVNDSELWRVVCQTDHTTVGFIHTKVSDSELDVESFQQHFYLCFEENSGYVSKDVFNRHLANTPVKSAMILTRLVGEDDCLDPLIRERGQA